MSNMKRTVVELQRHNKISNSNISLLNKLLAYSLFMMASLSVSL
ncbi:hypothetical protein THF1D04_40324 [Vibrio owensii]|uniref:Uncharacterized protein n=1 Tax=Vibrio owensii TaxID=696485 RepID=A0AAU9Q950_9VIBR|nr:hypothetical protein THF1D04_40324 [Vibrio owensii]